MMSSARLATSQFASSFATRPTVVASAPGRVNLIGEHTDYNGGPVLPVALERRTAVAASPAAEWRVVTSLDGAVHQLDVAGSLRRDWTDYLVGVVRELGSRGVALAGAHVAVAGTVPAGAGLSSSAALNERRRECEEALALCRTWRPGLRFLAQLAPADLPEIARRLPPPLVPRVRHVVTETARTRAAALALAAGDLATVGRLLVEGHASLREDYRSTVPEADFLVERATAHGAYGARLTGAGWGGAVVVLAPADRETRILAELSRDFGDRFGRSPEAWSTRAAGGVRREAIPAPTS
jgi:galactokinase